VVLLVLITFMAIGIIWAFVKPMIYESLDEGGTCFELRDHAKIPESDFTCYNETSGNTILMIERGFEETEIRGFIVAILSEGESKTYDISVGTTANVKMYNPVTKGFDLDVELPGLGEAKSYSFGNLKGTEAELVVVTKDDKKCEMGSFDIPYCL